MKFNDLSGTRFHRLLVLRRIVPPRSRTRYLCLCDCGSKVKIYRENLQRVISCGCYHREHPPAQTHGHTRDRNVTREYRSWSNAKTRCFNPRSPAFKNYGGRGITMCEEWQNDFETFFRDMGPCPPSYTIERRNNDGNYEPSNCYWATRLEQSKNCRPRKPFSSAKEKCPQCGKYFKLLVHHQIWEQRKEHQRKRIIGPTPPSI